ncbi:methionine/alanine import family NSS transporter small subunit [Saliterribacillus persicus]|uniref:Putative methionine/alanine importer small subunit n=1 Tax=Saliterribacillus persicus TaxID=930114 RepID=A0A368XGK4_9BACI|nr:methionine/alanine import family NSS transporter small subunit [Saliterribacillus persicus]RCW66965.1 putative methionine/alanine importer small subunit [Saliterribacillus persicus]
MSASAIVMAVIGIVIIWGGLTASIIHAVRSSK